VKLLIDMNLSPRWVDLLRSAGFEAHWSTVGPPDAPDTTIMAFATTNGFVVLTSDLDFSAILAATQGAKPSVVQVRAGDVSPNAIGMLVIAALRQMATKLEDGALLSIDPNHSALGYISPAEAERRAA
jgi:predicted nuclease of predicted toxin-antitoxin system